MLEITTTGPSSAVVRFVVEDVASYGRVSVVGSFNAWTPGAHELTPDDDGTGSVSAEVSTTEDLHFRYLATNGAWFDEVDADAVTEYGSVIVDFRRGAESLQADPEASQSGLGEAASTEAQHDANRGSTKAATAPREEASAAAAPLENGPANAASAAHEGVHRPDTVPPTESTTAASSPAPATNAGGSERQQRSTDGFVWSHTEDDELNPEDHPVTPRDVREGRVADPNLGDLPVDDQPRRGTIR